jgi:hypothetical protein
VLIGDVIRYVARVMHVFDDVVLEVAHTFFLLTLSLFFSYLSLPRVCQELSNRSTMSAVSFRAAKPLEVGGPGWSFVKLYDKRKDGRNAVLALKKQAEGQAVKGSEV